MTNKPWWLLALLPSLALAQSLPAPLDETTGNVVVPVVPAGPAPWAALDAAGRADARARYAAWRALDESERARVRQAAARVASLPPDQQQALRTRFGAMDRLHRDGWRMGPRIGAEYPGLQPMFGYVPPAQRDAALALLAALDAEQLARLSVISRRTAPQDRAAVRAELLALPPAARAAWLRARAGR